MAYKKFDDANPKVDQSFGKILGAFPIEAIRIALQGISNRVLTGNAGTSALAACANGGTCGVKIGNGVVCVINGAVVSNTSIDNIRIPFGTMGSNKAAKYLISVDNSGTHGVCTGPGNVVDVADYVSAAAAVAATKLPDLPDGNCAVGYFSVVSPPTTDVVFADNSVLGTTGGTAAYSNVVCMPYSG